MHYNGTTGNDDIDGTNNADQFNLKQGGEDIAHGGGNDDYFTMGGAFDAGDTIDGGTGTDIISLNGNYFGARALHFAAHTMNNIEHMVLGAGHDYDLRFVSANIDGEFLIHAENLGASDRLILRTAGIQVFGVLAGAGDDVLTKGSTGLDVFDLSLGGNDTVHAGGLCNVIMGAALNAGDTLEEVSEIHLDGDYTGVNRLVMGTHVVNKSTVYYDFATGHDYDVVMNDANLVGTNAVIGSASVGASNSFRFDGSAEDDGFFQFVAGGADDRLTGGARGDTFQLVFGGNDTIFGGGGNDVVEGGDSIDAADRVDGGDGNDTLSLAGINYDLTLTSKFLSIETLKFDGANNFVIRTVDANVAAGKTMTVDARGVNSTGGVEFYGGSEKDGNFIFKGGDVTTVFAGGHGDDIVRGGAGGYTVYFTLGGNDTVYGAQMLHASVFMDAALTAADSIQNVFDVYLDGNYSGAKRLVLGPTTIVDVDILVLADNHNYDITANEGTIVRKARSFIEARALDATHHLIFDGSAETTGAFDVACGASNDRVTGSAGNDSFYMYSGGHDTVHGGPGDDTIYAGAAYDPGDRFDGGAGFDTLDISDTDYVFLPVPDNLTSIERINFEPFQTYLLEMVDGNVGAGKTMEIEGTSLSGPDHLHIDASRETDGKYVFLCGDGDDIIVGSHGDDIFHGGFGKDVFLGGPGADRLDYLEAEESTSTSYDTVHGFAGSVDRFDLDVTVTGINMRFNGGAVHSATFDNDMEDAISAGHLGKHHAVLCDLSGGDFDGDTFLAIDANGVSGYQAGHDYLICVIDFGSLNVNIFI